MDENLPNASDDSDEEINALVKQLHETQKRLDELTRERPDRAKKVSPISLVEAQIAILNALPARVALLDPQGVILAVNDACRGLDSTEVMQSADFVVGHNYLEACEQAVSVNGSDARKAAEGTRRVLRGEAETFSMEYASHSSAEPTWISFSVLPLEKSGFSGVILLHSDITEHKLAAQALLASEECTRAIVESSLDAIVTMDQEGLITEFNPVAEQIFGWLRSQALGREMADLIIPERFREGHRRGLARYLQTSNSKILSQRLEFPALKADGTEFPVELTITRLGQLEPPQFTGFLRDITASKAAETKISRLNRLHTVQSKVGEAIVRTRDRAELFAAVCRILVDDGLFALTCIIETTGETEMARPVAAAGDALGYLDDFRMVTEDGELSQGVISTVIQTGEADFCNDFAHDPRMAPWRDRALRHGFHSSGAFPVKVDGRTTGALVLYATEVGYFQEDEMSLMVSVANTLSYALESLEKEKRRQQSESDLRASEELFSSAFQSAATGMALGGRASKYLKVNPALCEFLGYSEEELLQISYLDVSHPDDLPDDNAKMMALLAGETTSYEIEKRYIHKAGHSVWAMVQISIVNYEDGKPFLLIAQVQDITARKQTEADLDLTLDRLNDAQRIGQMGDWDWDIAANEMSWSPFVYEIFGLDPQLPTPKFEEMADLYEPSSWARLQSNVDRAIATGEPQEYDLVIVRPGGERVFARSKAVPRKDENGKVIGLYGTIQDISKRKLAEEERDRLFNFSLDLLCVSNFDGTFEQVNPAWTTALGWSAEELISQPWRNFLHPEDVAATLLAGEQLLQGVESRNFENRYRCKDGTYRWLLWNSQPLMDARQVFSVVHDVTQRRQDDEHLRLLETSISRLKDIVIITEAEPLQEPGPRIIYVNDAFVKRTGYSREEVLGRSPRFLQGPKTQRDALNRIHAALQTRQPIREELINYSKSGEEFWLEIEIVPVADGNGNFTHLVSIQRDISERKRTEETLRQSDLLQRIAARLGRLGAWAVNLRENKITWSDEVCIIHGMPPGHSPNLEEGISYYAPEARATIREAFAACAAEGTPFDLELPLITASGRRIYVRSIGEAARDAQGAIYSVEGAFQDITDRKEAEQTLRTSEERFRLLSKATNDAIWDWDMETDLLWWNEGFEALFGYHPSEVEPSSVSWSTRIHPDEKGPIEASIRQALASDDESWIGDYRFLCKDGTYSHVMDRGHIIRDDAGKALRMIGGMTDLTERIKAEEALRESEERFRDLLKNVPTVAVQGYAMDGSVQYWNQASETLYGYTAEEAIGRNLLDLLIPPEMRNDVTEAIRRVAEEGINIPPGELHLLRKDGTRIPVFSSHAIVRRAGHPPELFCIDIDLSERLRAEAELANTNRALQLLSRCNEALIRSETEADLLETICQTAVDVGGFPLVWVGYALDDPKKTILPQASAGVEQDYLLNLQLTWADDEKFGQGPAGKTILSGESAVLIDLETDPSFGPWRDNALSHGFRGIISLPLKDPNRTFGVLILYLPEVRQTLPDEMRILRELADDMAFGIINIRSRLDRQRIQSAMIKVATAVSAASGKAFFQQLARNMAEAVGAQAGVVAQFLPGEKPTARTIAAVVDETLIENFDYSLIDNPCEAYLTHETCIIHQEIMEKFPDSALFTQLHAQGYVGRRLDSSTGKFLGLLFVLFREPLTQTGFTTSMLQIFAARAASELERQQADAHISEQAALLDKAQDAIYVRDMDNLVTYWNKSAERLFGWTFEEALGRQTLDLFQIDPVDFARADQAVRKAGEWNGELQKTSRHGTALTLDCRLTLLRDADDIPRGILVIDTDITDRKKIEQQFLRAQRMESIGTLAGGIAHDLNNSLAPVIMSLDLLKMRFTDEDSRSLLATISSSARRGADMVKQVLSFARGVEGRRIEVEIHHLIRDIEKIANDTFLKNILVKSTLPNDLWTVLGDPTQLHQVLLNLCVNARDAMPDGGQLSLSAQNIQIDSHYAGLNAEAKAGPYVSLQIEDSGTGMPPEIVEKIFDPFFTTKQIGEGTGLGLSTSLAIIKSHGGYIRVYSEPGKGTKFKIYLPAQIEGAWKPPSAETELPRGHGELILVVDDEPSVRDITRQTLEAFGYCVLLACEGSEAVGIYASRGSEIAVVLTDMMMPVLDGPATIRVLRKMNPLVRIIGASGLSANGHVVKAASLGIKHFLPKPYTAETLLKALRDILAGQ